jgi:hypothetical protein
LTGRASPADVDRNRNTPNNSLERLLSIARRRPRLTWRSVFSSRIGRSVKSLRMLLSPRPRSAGLLRTAGRSAAEGAGNVVLKEMRYVAFERPSQIVEEVCMGSDWEKHADAE